MNKTRPVNLDLATLRFPPMAIISILHRISGTVLFLLLPVMLCLLGMSLKSADSFDKLQSVLASPYMKVLVWGFSSALAFHFIAGIRHLFLDMGLGEEVASAKKSAIVAIALAIIAILGLGVWIW